MVFIAFLLGFMLCGFIVYGIFTYVVFKTLRAEDINGVTVEFKRKYKIPSYSDYYVGPKNVSYNQMVRPTVYVKNEAEDIAEIFDDFLCSKGIKVPSDDDSDREECNDAAIYGTDFAELTDKIKSYLIHMCNRVKNGAEINTGDYYNT